jgi:hypothetical protein
MLKIFKCRRSSLALLAMGLLTWIALKNEVDVSIAIAGIVAGIAASNSYQASKGKGE